LLHSLETAAEDQPTFGGTERLLQQVRHGQLLVEVAQLVQRPDRPVLECISDHGLIGRDADRFV